MYICDICLNENKLEVDARSTPKMRSYEYSWFTSNGKREQRLKIDMCVKHSREWHKENNDIEKTSSVVTEYMKSMDILFLRWVNRGGLDNKMKALIKKRDEDNIKKMMKK
ncbi:MAG: hypothetical protein ACYCS1_05355 [Gammaproteobacteria bacterium]